MAWGFWAWKYSLDSLCTKIASGRTGKTACMASTFALTMCLRAVTKPVSVVICSFHQPYLAEKRAQTYISLTGV